MIFPIRKPDGWGFSVTLVPEGFKEISIKDIKEVIRHD